MSRPNGLSLSQCYDHRPLAAQPHTKRRPPAPPNLGAMVAATVIGLTAFTVVALLIAEAQ